MRSTLSHLDENMINDIVSEVVEQLNATIEDLIHQHDVYDDEYNGVKKEVLRSVLENIEETYNE